VFVTGQIKMTYNCDLKNSICLSKKENMKTHRMKINYAKKVETRKIMLEQFKVTKSKHHRAML
jgi:hypothetical protein